MKKLVFVALIVLGAGAAAVATQYPELNPHPRALPTNERFVHENAGGGGSGGNLTNHGGPTITSAKVIPIFWGPSWSSGSDASLATSIQSYVTRYGTTGEYNTITQYSGIQLSSLASAGNALFDTSTPLQNVTDAAIQAEVKKMVQSPRSDTIYEVFLPAASYSSNGTATSCNGPNLTYCAYHGNFANGTTDVKYASMPYPSCASCTTSGFTTAQNFEHFISHETREAVTDADGTAWFDRRGYEADDKCAWSPTPFADASTGTNQDGSGFAYQYEWSNANSACVKTR